MPFPFGMLATLCHNPDAGAGDHSKSALLAALERANIEARYCNTESDEFLKMLSEAADLVIAAGGDGTVAKVARTMPGRGVPLAIVPLGSANNIARSFKIAGSARELAKGWDLDRWKPLDIGLVTGPWGERSFVEAVGVGSIPDVIAKKSKDKQTDKIRAGRDALRDQLAKAREIDVLLLLDAKEVPVDTVLAIEIVNIAYTGPRLPLLAPGVKATGTLGIVVISAKERDATMSWLEAPHARRAPFSRFTGRRVEISWTGARLRVDDDVVELRRGPQYAAAQIDGPCVKLLTPAGAR